MLYEFRDPAFVIKLVRFFGLLALVFYEDTDTLVEKRLFSKSFRKFLETVHACLENIGIGSECDLRATLRCLTGLLQRSDWEAHFVLLFECFSITPDLELEPFGKKINARYTDAVQPTGHLVGIRIKFSARVKYGQ